MKSQVGEVLARMFQKHRIIFWYDDEKTLRKDFEAVELDGVDLPMNSNAFWLKHGLYSRSFRADKASILLQELGLANLHLRIHVSEDTKKHKNRTE